MPKDFSNNAALRFLTPSPGQKPEKPAAETAPETEATPEEIQTAAPETRDAEPVNEPAATEPDEETPVSEPAAEAPPVPRRKAPKKPTKKVKVEYKLDPRYVEKRTRRLQLILQPSLYERVKDRAKELDVSVNDYIHNILDEATREEK